MGHRQRITVTAVGKLSAGEVLWDSEVRGFGVRRQTDKRSYFLKARVTGRQRWITIGEHGAPWTPDTARKEAQRLWGEIRGGHDPASRRASHSARTVAELARRYMEEHARERKKPSSVRSDEKNIANYVIPLLGRMDLSAITRDDIDDFRRRVRDGKTPTARQRARGYRGGAVVTGGPGVANRCLALLSKMFNLAEKWGLRPDGTNPVRHIEKYAEGRRERFLSAEEMLRLGKALRQAEKESENPFALAAIRLLVFTGARLGEILTLRWSQIDMKRAVAILPDSKTGQKRLYFNEPAMEILAMVPRLEGNPYVIAGHRRQSHLVNLQKPWQRIRESAGLSDVRLHDLRHSFASIAVSSGHTLPVIGKLLGHRKAATTERYAHLADDPLRAANDLIGAELAKAFGKNIALDAVRGRPSS